MRLISGKAALTASALGAAVLASLLGGPAIQAEDTYDVIQTVPTGAGPWGIALSSDGEKVFVAESTSGTLSIIDTGTLTGPSVGIGGSPGYVAVTPDDATAYAPAYSDDSVAIIDVASATRTGSITGMNNPWAMALYGDDSLFVYDYGTNAPLRRINLLTGLEDDSVVMPSSYAWSATLSASGETLYSMHPAAERLFVVNTSDMTVTTQIPVVGQPRYAAMSPDQAYLYVTSNPVGGPALLLRLNTQTLNVDDSWALAPNSYRAFGVATSPDGSKIYVAVETPAAAPGSLAIVDAATGQVDDSITVGIDPYGVAVSPSGDRIYVTNNLSNTMSVIEVRSPQPPAPTPAVPANAPRDVMAIAGDASASVSWSVPSSSGSFPVTYYQAVASPGGRSCLVAAPATTCEVSRLMNGTSYTFTVKALTGAGWSAASGSSDAVTPQPNARPTVTITGTRDGRMIVVSGTSTGLDMGAVLKPWLRRAGESGFTQKRAEVLVNMDGTFAWQHRASRKVSVYLQTPDGMRSNTVTIRSR